MPQETVSVPFTDRTITADVGINEGALGIIERGYTEATRCLNFRVGFYEGKGAGAACRVISSYNDFDGEAVAKALEALPNADKVWVGRENSPVVYVRTRDGNTTPVVLALDAVGADECGAGPDGVVRAWWD